MPSQIEIARRSESPGDFPRCRAALWLALIYIASALLRYLGKEPMGSPYIFGDELWHVEYARSILAWDGLRWGGLINNHPSWLYPLIIAPAFEWLPRGRALDGVFAINALCISTAIPLTYGLARPYASRRRALAAAGLTALLTTMAHAATVMAENIFFPMSIAAFWLALAAMERPTIARRAAAGAMFGLLYHAKPQGLFFPILFGIAIIIEACFVPAGRERLRFATAHWLTALGWFAGAFLPRWIETVHFEHAPRPFGLTAFFGSYAGRAYGDHPFLWSGFLYMIAGNFALLAVASGVVPFFDFFRTAMGSIRAAAPPPRRQFAILTAAATLTIVLSSARHTVITDPDLCVYERYLMVLQPLFFIAFAAQFPTPSAIDRRARSLAWIAIPAILATSALLAYQVRWLLWTSLPSYSMAWFFDERTGHYAQTLGGLALLTVPAGLFILWRQRRAGKWSFGLQAALAALILLALNYGYYVTTQLAMKGITRDDRALAQKIDRRLPAGKTLVMLMNGVPDDLYYKIAVRIPTLPVALGTPANWYVRLLSLSPAGVPQLPVDPRQCWLLAPARLAMTIPPLARVGLYNMYDLGSYPPPSVDLAKLGTTVSESEFSIPPATDGFPAQFELTWLSVKLPRQWQAGDTATVRVSLRNNSPFALRPGERRYAMGYHWTNPDITGNWVPLVGDDGNYAWLPDELLPGQSVDLEMRIAVPRPARGGWVLTLSPLMAGAHDRIWGESARCKIFTNQIIEE